MKVNIGAECLKLAYRREAQAGLLIFALLPALLIISLRFSESVTFAGEKTPVGLTTASMAMMLSTILAPMLVVIVTAGSLARERQTGEIRFMLLQPHQRSVILTGKAVALVLYIAIALLITLLTGLILATLLFGPGQSDPTATTPETVDRLLGMFGVAGLGLVSLMAITLLLATYFSYGATVMLVLSLLVLMQVLGQLEQAQPYLLTYAWNTANYSLDSSQSTDLSRALLVLITYFLIGIGAAFWSFERRDIVA